MDTNKKSTIAAFDFDGTITTKDTFLDFALKQVGFLPLSFVIFRKSISLLLCFLRLRSFSLIKEQVFSDLYKGSSVGDFNRMCLEYSHKVVPTILNNEAVKKIRWHKQQGHKLVIVSASLETWIQPWAETEDFDMIIATVPEVIDGVLTGRFKTENCNNQEKVRRFLQEYPHRQDYYMYAYGDTYKDKPLLDIADEAFYRKF